ncbi:cation:proton antiporter [Thioalkalivibrio denitrificans]|uniref:Cation:proton antiporter n=1 Tax=Thioalkalivibrio denitrificans TaxID=108003 RepID=A0A1V3ND44_9GAMM|nr:Na+/H+ antiporter subunit E [Thioalkalivibrio denitrificans]OOG22706.1 cation:proton antiporter [Thioalkalivibrio denitrificans]
MAGFVQRLLIYGVLWWILAGGSPSAWFWGLPAILAAALFNPFPPARPISWHPLGLLVFVAMFLMLSLRGALDVAWRALHPRRPLQPAVVDYPWALPPGRGRVFLAVLINLMPGTLCVKITDHSMSVHVLSNPDRAVSALQRLERRVGRLFGSDTKETHHV